MKERFFLMVCMFMLPFFSEAQVAIDKANLKCLYNYSCVSDLLRPERYVNDEMLLLIGSKYTSFYSQTNFTTDSLRQANPAEFAPGVSTVDGVITVIPAKNPLRRRTHSSEIYLIDRSTGKFQCWDKIGTSLYSYNETIVNPSWIISSDTCSVLGYTCQKATTNYGGREWTAWFAPEIPISEGPWKLRGLPGLILKAASSDNQFSFVAAGLERAPNLGSIVTYDGDNAYRKIAKKDFFSVKKRFWEKPFADEGVTITSSSAGAFRLDFNFIEKL